MRLKRRVGARIGFSNEKFIELLSSTLGISPTGVLGRETPLDFSSPRAARDSLLLRELFSKYDDGSPSPEKDSETWKRFHAAEGACLLSNSSIPRTFRADPFWACVYARIRDCLGSFSWNECQRFFSFGPGGTTRLPRRKAAPAYKYSGIPESTSGCAVLSDCAIRMIPLWKHNVLFSGGTPEALVKVVPGNSVLTVPKNYKTDRTIAKEPCMNIYIQKGIGQVIRRRLSRVGVNLADQRLNQRAALQGSIDDSLATIDLSMASDTVSFELVSYLLPNDWWWALEQVRSPVGVLPSGEQIRYQKFSSMGNGYTFELESLFFWAIAQEVCNPFSQERDCRVKVYGDDLVVPSVFANDVLFRLQEAGFTPNPSKTFVSGPYRESCGKHYFLGHDITPFYVRRPVDQLTRLFLVHNNLKCWDGWDEGVSAILGALRALAPASWREPRLPDGFGDGAFIGAVDELRLDSHPHGWECWQAKVLLTSQEELQDNLPDGQLIASLEANQKSVASSSLVEAGLDERLSGLPVREGKVRTSVVRIPRYPTA